MENLTNRIGPMKKVTLKIEAGRTRDRMDLTRSPISFEFIFGLGITGLSAFEKALDGKACGSTVFLRIDSLETPHMVEHLSLPLDDFIHMAPVFYLMATVEKVAVAEDREVVSAMARGSACGQDGCGCGCH